MPLRKVEALNESMSCTRTLREVDDQAAGHGLSDRQEARFSRVDLTAGLQVSQSPVEFCRV
jgi:hypothetical protein